MTRALAVLLLTCSACSLEPVDFATKRCPCDEGWRCDPATDTCLPEGFDAGPPDAGPPDAGPPDAGPLDGGGSMDAGAPDGGGSVDAGVDAGPPDGGPPDSGPVTTTVVVESFADTYVDATMPAASFGTANVLLVDADPTIYNTLIRPDDLGGVPSGSTVVSATLELTCFNEGSEAHVYVVADAWDESVTWNTRPSSAASSAASFVPMPVGRVTVDLTSVVQGWVDGTPNHGVVIRSSGIDGSDYRSSEYGTASERPTLTIEYY